MMNQPSTGSGHASQETPLDHTIVGIPAKPALSRPVPPPMPRHEKLPFLDLLQEGQRANYVRFAVPLYEAAIKGDWKAAKPFLDEQPNLIRFAITENYETLLHVAASAESTKAVEEFVMNLVNLMKIEDLELQNNNQDTALSLAAAIGNVKTAMIMLNKHPGLIEIPGKSKKLPLYISALFAKQDMVRYLYERSNQLTGTFWSNDNCGWLLQKCVEADIFDVALKIVNDRSDLILKNRLLTDVLLALARNPEAFKKKKPYTIFRIIYSLFRVKVGPHENEREAVRLLRIIWEKTAKMPKADIHDILRGPYVKFEKEKNETKNEGVPLLRIILERIGTMRESETEKEDEKEMKRYHSRVLFVATKMGNTRFITELIRLYPDLIWKQDDNGKTIFHSAVRCRQIKIYKLLYEIGAMRELITPITDNKGNNMLHMVAKSVKQKRFENVSGVAFQMQRELLWFKEVEKMIPLDYRQMKNNDGKTPQELFSQTHEGLVKDGGKWMKYTASQCMVVATLVATIVFAAAFTVPGGYNQNTGIPFFRKEPSLIIFVISDALSLICSSTSALIFLSILTSRYAEQDFLESLPKKLVNGIATLFLSIVTMMIAFSASFFVLYNKKLEWMPIVITCLAGIPVILYVLLQNDLFVDVFKSAYRSGYLFKHKKRILYY